MLRRVAITAAAAAGRRPRGARLLFSAAAGAGQREGDAVARRILCLDAPHAAMVQELVARGHHVELASTSDAARVAAVAASCDALLAAPHSHVPRELLTNGQLQLVAVPADAFDSARVDVPAATSHGVLLLQLEPKQAGDKFSVEAELALSLLVQLARHVPAATAATRAGAPFQRESFSGTELAGKRLGIVGLGQAGKRAVEMAAAMGLQVFGYDPNLTHEAAELMGVKRVALDELYAACDFLLFHAPLTARTRGMFDAAALAQCKPGVKIVSVAEYKGLHGLLDERTLLEGLASGQISGVALDVLQAADEGDELPDAWQQLRAHERVIFSAHVDAKSSGEVELAKKYRMISENVCDALAQRYFRGVANAVFLPLTLVPEMQPFLRLSEALGRFLYQLVVSSSPRDAVAKVAIATSGGVQVDITSPKAKSALQAAVMKGVLESLAQHRGAAALGAPKVSLINASMVAMAHGIDVRQGELAGAEVQHLSNSVTVAVETKAKSKVLVTGSVFGEDPRVVRVNEYTDFPAFRPEGNLLIFHNEDKPGAIAGILRELAQAQINIANFGLSRQENVAMALGILALDAEPSRETLATLKQLPTVQSIQFAKI